MTCYNPLEAWRADDGTVHFNSRWRHRDRGLRLPCGQCIGCRLERSKQWAIRCVHEAQLHQRNCFITLTYAPEHLPFPPTLDVREFQLFMKRYRKRFGAGIRFFHCGEYGEKSLRPHYHACIFGHDFDDRVLWKHANGIPLYTSQALSELWPFGWSVIGEVNFESAAYVARYIMKKITGDASDAHYTRVDDRTGEVYSAKPEYVTMSRRPGIAHGWFEKFGSDVFPHDHVIMRGREMRPPRYYDNLAKSSGAFDWDAVEHNRYVKALNYVDDQSEQRLDVRRVVQEVRLKKLPRPL